MRRNEFYSYLYLVFSLSILLLVYLTGIEREQLNLVNFVVATSSITISFFLLSSILKRGVKFYNLVGFVFFFSLFMNALALSNRQLVKQWGDLNLLFLGALIMLTIVFFFESAPTPVIKKVLVLEANLFFWVVLVSFVFLKLYVGSRVGFKAMYLGVEGADLSFSAYAIPGISGVIGILQWLILIFAFYVTPKLRWVGLLCLIIFNSILGANRGDLMRTLSFILLFSVFDYRYGADMLKSRVLGNKKLFFFMFSIFISVFVVAGSLREGLQAREISSIVDLSDFLIDSEFLAWIYTYMSLGFDNLILYRRYDVIGDWSYLSAFLNPSNISATPVHLTLWPFNQVTFVRGYFAALGDFYFILVFFKSVVIGFFLYLAKLFNFRGLGVFIINFGVLSFFSDYFLSRSVLSAIVLAILIFPFLKVRERCLKPGYF